jgi:predicted RNA binding protein YcfA (HicA-like mRNA interferase family)
MSRIVPLPAKKVVKALEKVGFQPVRQKGSHLFLEHLDGRTTVLPIHPNKDLKVNLINKILKDAGISRDEWVELINNLIIF